jgi:hypothetical protein
MFLNVVQIHFVTPISHHIIINPLLKFLQYIIYNIYEY